MTDAALEEMRGVLSLFAQKHCEKTVIIHKF